MVNAWNTHRMWSIIVLVNSKLFKYGMELKQLEDAFLIQILILKERIVGYMNSFHSKELMMIVLVINAIKII